MQILDKLKETLVEICFSGNSSKPDYAIDPAKTAQFKEILKFGKLQKFSLSLDTSETWRLSDYSNLNLVNVTSPGDQVLPGCGIKSLGLDSRDTWIRSFINLSLPFPNLNEITIGPLSPIGLQFLSNLVRPLRTLILTGLDTFQHRHLSQFEQLLEKHSKTLVNLEFVLPIEEETTFPLRFPLSLPVFEVLINLVIGFPSERNERGLAMMIEFGSEEIPPFEKCLASLKLLSLRIVTDIKEYSVPSSNIVFWQEFGALFETFFSCRG